MFIPLFINHKRPSKQAFTLMELLLVMAIIAIIAGASAPFLSRFVLQNAVTTTTEHVVSVLHKAQEYTIAGKDDSAWQVVLSGNDLTLVRQSDSAVFDTYSKNSNVIITGLTTALYSRPLGQITPALTINVSGGSTSKDIIVNTEGVVSY